MPRYPPPRLELKRQLRGFYARDPPDLEGISDVGHRHFRVVLTGGRFLKLKDRIRVPQQLQRWLLKLAPGDVYYSTSTYLNPTIVKPRPKSREGFLDSGLVLRHDIAFDIDVPPLSLRNLEKARLEALKVHRYMEADGYTLKYIAFSGSKGFHIVFEDPDTEVIADPYDRETGLIKKRTALVDEVIKKEIKIDSAITKDTRRIIRVPGTINSKTGYACTTLKLDELEVPVKDWLPDVPRLPVFAKIGRIPWPRIPLPTKLLRPKPARKYQTGIFYTTFLLSPVLGLVGRHAILMSFPNKSPDRIATRLEPLVERFGLTDIYLFTLADRVQAICLKTVQRNRLQKILEAAGAANAAHARKYDLASIRVGPLVNERQIEVDPPVSYCKIVVAPAERNLTTYVSAGHLHFLKKHGLDGLDYPQVHGNRQFKVMDSVLQI